MCDFYKEIYVQSFRHLYEYTPGESACLTVIYLHLFFRVSRFFVLICTEVLLLYCINQGFTIILFHVFIVFAMFGDVKEVDNVLPSVVFPSDSA